MLFPEVLTHSESTAPTVKRLPMNTRGRDFVVGDLHGAFELLERAMDAVRFDPSCDRLLSVGDLIDRGLDSARALDYLRRPYVHAVRGNHEHDFMSSKPSDVRLMAGIRADWTRWARQLTTPQVEEMQAAFRNCPIALELETPIGLVGLVHADVPRGMNWAEFLARLEAGDRTVLREAMTGSVRAKDDLAEPVQGVARVFVGHTPMFDGMARRGNVWFIDTGAIFRQMNVVVEGYDEVKGMLTLADAAAPDHELEAWALVEDGVAIAGLAFEAEGCLERARC